MMTHHHHQTPKDSLAKTLEAWVDRHSSPPGISQEMPGVPGKAERGGDLECERRSQPRPRESRSAVVTGSLVLAPDSLHVDPWGPGVESAVRAGGASEMREAKEGREGREAPASLPAQELYGRVMGARSASQSPPPSYAPASRVSLHASRPPPSPPPPFDVSPSHSSSPQARARTYFAPSPTPEVAGSQLVGSQPPIYSVGSGSPRAPPRGRAPRPPVVYAEFGDA